MCICIHIQTRYIRMNVYMHTHVHTHAHKIHVHTYTYTDRCTASIDTAGVDVVQEAISTDASPELAPRGECKLSVTKSIALKRRLYSSDVGGTRCEALAMLASCAMLSGPPPVRVCGFRVMV